MQLLSMSIPVEESIEIIPFPALLGKNGVFVYANTQALLLLEADDINQIIGKNALDFAHEDYINEIWGEIELARERQGCPFNEKKIITLKQNVIKIESTLIPITVQGQELDYVIIKNYKEVSDIELQYNMQKKHYQALIDNSIDTIAIYCDNVYEYINNAGVKLFGAKHEHEIIGKTVMDLYHPRYHEDIIQRVEETLKSQEVSPSIERELIRLDGESRFVETVMLPFFHENKPALQVIIRDITEQKRNIHNKIQSEKLSTVGQLSAGIAHEIRNPLTSIKGFLQLLEEKFPKEDLRYLEIVKGEIDKIERITGEMLSLSKPQAIKYTTNNLTVLMDEVITLLEPQANLRNVKLKTVFEKENISMVSDQSRIKQVFINLIKNAIESMKNVGTVTAKIRCDINHIIIEIEDTGCGIPEDFVKRINEPFFTTKEKGTGLGLTICQNIVKEHFGEITVTTKENEGTTFTIMFPKGCLFV